MSPPVRPVTVESRPRLAATRPRPTLASSSTSATASSIGAVELEDEIRRDSGHAVDALHAPAAFK